MSENRCWLLVATSAGPVGLTPTWSFSWLLGLPHSMDGWVPRTKTLKRNRQKLFAFYYLALESHHVTSVCNPTSFKKKHRPYFLMVGLSDSHSKNNMWNESTCCIHIWKRASATPPLRRLDSFSVKVKIIRIFWSYSQVHSLIYFTGLAPYSRAPPQGFHIRGLQVNHIEDPSTSDSP